MDGENQFSLPETVESLDVVPDDLKGFYFERDGKIQRQDPKALVSTLAKVRREGEARDKELQETKGALAAYQETLGDDADPDIVRALKEKAARADELPTDADVQKRIEKIEENYKKQLGLKDNEIASREKVIEQDLVDGRLSAALIEADADKDCVDLLTTSMRERVDRAYENGRIKLVPLDKDGTRLYREDGSDATLVDLAMEIRAARPKLFNGTANRGLGSGAEASNVPADAKNWYHMSAREKNDFRAKHGETVTARLIAQSER